MRMVREFLIIAVSIMQDWRRGSAEVTELQGVLTEAHTWVEAEFLDLAQA
jgi:hypothetical protein